MNLNYLVLLCFVLVRGGSNARQTRNGEKVDIRRSIRPPAILRAGESVAPQPGWSHCVHNIRAGSFWGTISSRTLRNLRETQFQCTWMITAEASRKVVVAVQRLTYGSSASARCRTQFLEIIDSGKTQGKYCVRRHPTGDYVARGSVVRIDIQGESELARLIRDRRNPFVFIYKSVPRTIVSGFRSTTSRISGINTYTETPPTISSNTPGDRKKKDKNKKYGALTLSGLIAVIVCSALVVLIIIILLIRRCCFNEKQQEKNDREELGSGLPAKDKASYQYSLGDNELIITSETVVPLRSARTPTNHNGHAGNMKEVKNKKHRDRSEKTKDRGVEAPSSGRKTGVNSTSAKKKTLKARNTRRADANREKERRRKVDNNNVTSNKNNNRRVEQRSSANSRTQIRPKQRPRESSDDRPSTRGRKPKTDQRRSKNKSRDATKSAKTPPGGHGTDKKKTKRRKSLKKVIATPYSRYRA
ncbi:uncharacterized protein LOC100187518 [Ciona intestinalis]